MSAREVSWLIRDLDASKVTGPEEIPVVVLKNISPDVSPILVKLFNHCLKEKTFPSSRKMSSVCPILKKTRMSVMIHLNIDQLAFFAL